MKRVIPTTLLLSIMLYSCTMEQESERLPFNSQSEQGANLFKKETEIPANPVNVFDDAGRLHNDLSEAYLSAFENPTSIIEAISNFGIIAGTNQDFVNLGQTDTAMPSEQEMTTLLTEEPSKVSDIIQRSTLSWRSKISLVNFITTLQLFKEQQKPYESIYEFIVDYEKSINDDNTFPDYDKRVIFTTSSVARYAFYFATKHRRRPRDRDWEISVANIIGGTQGAETGTSKAISMAAIGGIITNN